MSHSKISVFLQFGVTKAFREMQSKYIGVHWNTIGVLSEYYRITIGIPPEYHQRKLSPQKTFTTHFVHSSTFRNV